MAGVHLSAREFLAREIRRARESKGMSRASVGKSLFVSGELVAAWESGRSLPRPEHMTALIKVLDFGPDIVCRILEDLVSGEVSPEWTGKWLAIEEKATKILSCENSHVPGLLQTEAYARAVLCHNHHSPLDVEEQVQERLRRQHVVFGRDVPPMMVFVIDEQALRRPVGGPKVMSDQLKHLVEMSTHPKVILHVIPVDGSGYHPGLLGGFMIARFDGTEVGYQDGILQGHVIERDDQVSALSQIWENVRSLALPQAASVSLVSQMAEQWDS
jgi:transcriptional regulator with XRE-family HTH domain